MTGSIMKILTDSENRYAVESNIPIAPRKASEMAYPFLDMNVGDSFALKTNTHRECINVRGAISHWNRFHKPMKFGLRLDKSSGKYRCWRLS